MPLVKCIDCGKMISDRVSACPECGCPIEYIVNKNDTNSNEKSKDTNSNAKLTERTDLKKISAIDFNIAGHQISCPEDQKALAHTFGDFIGLADSSVQYLECIYKEAGSLKNALIKVPQEAKNILEQVIDRAIKTMFMQGLNYTAEEFIEKYYYQHEIDYERFYKQAVEMYSKVLDLQEELKEYREMEKASRLRFSGGGFGVRGAIKGVAKASIMNAGLNFMHSFGDAAQESRDNEKINKQLRDLYASSKMKNLLCQSFGTCIMNVYYALKDEMVEIGKADSETFELNHNKANVLYENTIKYVEDRETVVSNVIQCIKLFPGDKKYYLEIIDEIYDEIWADLDDLASSSNFYGFLEYWGINYFFSREDIEKTVEDPAVLELIKVFTNRLQDVITNPIIKRVLNFDNKPVDQMNKKDINNLSRLLVKKNIGQYVFFYMNEVLLTDLFLSVNGAVFSIESIKRLDWARSDNEQILFCINHKEDDTPLVIDSEIPEIAANLFVPVFNYALGVEDADLKLKSKLTETEFDLAWTDSGMINIELNDEPETYVRVRKFIYDFCKQHNLQEAPPDSYYLNMLKAYFESIKKYAGFIAQYDIIEWIPLECTKQEFIQCLREDRRYLLESSLSAFWMYGDQWNSKYAPKTSVRNKFDRDDTLLMYKDFSLLQNGSKGFAVTEKYIIGLKNWIIIKLSDIIEIKVYRDVSINISDGTNTIIIKGSAFDEDYFDWQDEDSLIHIAKILRVYCVRYGNNEKLWEENMSSPKPKIQNKESDLKQEKQAENNIIQNKDTMFCPYCGKKISRTAKFCNFCGAKNTYTGEGVKL